jgi:hypothetical protein
MPLFTDADIVSLDDLLQFENSLVQVSSTHAIDVSAKIKLSISAIGDKVMLWLLKVGASDPQWTMRRRLGLWNVVVTPNLHRWLCFDSLSRFFAEAYNVQLNTRFQGKWTEYQAQASEAASIMFMSGIGIVYKPLPKPAMPSASFQNTANPTQALFIQTAWVDGNGNEGAVSPVNGLIVNEAATVAVAMAEGSTLAPPAASGWNLYASTSSNDLTRQNNAPLAIGSTSQLTALSVIDGPEAVGGQQADFYISLSRQIQRG